MREFTSRFPLSIDPHQTLRYVAAGPFDMVLNLGSGINPILGATNADSKSGLPNCDLVLDATQRWPIEDGTYDMVCSFHMIEHLPAEDVLHFFQEAHRVLRLAGVLIIECPDIVGLCQDVANGNLGALRQIYGGSAAEQDRHLWGYDRSSLLTLAKTAGFGAYYTGPGTDYHSVQLPTVRLEAVKVLGAVRSLPR